MRHFKSKLKSSNHLILKQCIVLLISLFSLVDLQAQTKQSIPKAELFQSPIREGTKTNITDSTCFCCDQFYNLPKPIINGPQKIECGSQTTFTTKICSGANTGWSVSPAIAGVTQTASSFTIPTNTPSGVYTLNVQYSCNRKVFASNQIQFEVIGAKTASQIFTLLQSKSPMER